MAAPLAHGRSRRENRMKAATVAIAAMAASTIADDVARCRADIDCVQVFNTARAASPKATCDPLRSSRSQAARRCSRASRTEGAQDEAHEVALHREPAGLRSTQPAKDRLGRGLGPTERRKAGERDDQDRARFSRGGNGRGDKIRTCDPLHPMQVRYQAALRPDRA